MGRWPCILENDIQYNDVDVTSSKALSWAKSRGRGGGCYVELQSRACEPGRHLKRVFSTYCYCYPSFLSTLIYVSQSWPLFVEFVCN
jgi:hypothetical protein